MEEAVQFPSPKARLFGILHQPERPTPAGEAILMVVGGPQTRVGCHRAYVDLARRLAAAGHSVLRFDYEGIGDSEGAFVGYERAAPSVRAAVDFLSARFPGKRLVLWSLCDGSAACLAYAYRDADRLGALILCNPYVHTDQGRARTFMRHYYLRKIFDPASLKRMITFQINPFAAALSFLRMAASALAPRREDKADPEAAATEGCFREESVRQVVAEGLRRYPGPIHVLLSENDFTAREFETLAKGEADLAAPLGEGRIALLPVAEADHTFSLAAYRARAAELTLRALAETAPARAA
jgi:exosortase A-associated hydrolase 1